MLVNADAVANNTQTSFFIRARTRHQLWNTIHTIQPVVKPVVVKPVWQPCWTNSHCSLNRTGCQTGLYNRIDNRLYTQHSHLSNRFDNQLNVCIHDTTSCETGLTTGCIVETGLKGIHTTYSSRSSAITHRSIAKIHVKDAVENFVGVSNCTFDILVPHNNSAMLWRHLHNTTTTTILRPFVRDHPGEPVPEETLTHPPSWSSSNLYQLLPSTTIHSILLVQITCLAIFLHNLFSCPLWSASWFGALHLIFHTLVHPISVFFSQHMPIPSQPVLLQYQYYITP